MSLDIRTYASVWDAVADDAGEAANLKLRSQLMDILDAYIDREAITQEEASRRFGVPRSRVSELVNGRISKFSIDKLVNMAARVGLVTRISVAQEVRPLDDPTVAVASGVTGTTRARPGRSPEGEGQTYAGARHSDAARYPNHGSPQAGTPAGPALLEIRCENFQ